VTPNAKRLRWTVAALLALVFVFLAGIAGAALWLRHQEILGGSGVRAASLADTLSEDLALRFDAIEAALAHLADHNRRIGGPNAPWDQWLPILGAAIAGLGTVDSISVTDAKGVVTYSTRTDTMGQSHAGSPIYEALSANPMSDALVADAPFRSPFDTSMLVPIGRVLRTPNGEFEGMLIATLAPARFAGIYRSVDVGPDGFVWVLQPAGKVLLRQPDFEDPIEQPMPDIPAAGAESGVAFGPIEAGGPDYLTAYHINQRTDLAVAVSLGADGLLLPWREDASIALALLAGAGFLLVIVGFAIDRTVHRTLAAAREPPFN
jgi:hypothetical protein